MESLLSDQRTLFAFLYPPGLPTYPHPSLRAVLRFIELDVLEAVGHGGSRGLGSLQVRRVVAHCTAGA